MARAFPPHGEVCSSNSPGVLPLIAPTTLDEPPCMLTPFAHDKWGGCPAFPPSAVTPVAGARAVPAGQQSSFVSGDHVDAIQHGISVFTGEVQFDQGDQRLTANRLVYDDATGLARVQQDVRFYTPRLTLESPSGIYDSNTGAASFRDAQFQLPIRHGRGSADLIDSLDSDHSELYGTHYTTCPLGQQDWYLDAADMELDQSTDTGEAHDVGIHFLGVPIFWSPYINFPLGDDRKSGFVGASMSFSVPDGFDLSAPYYFNLAENYDALLVPRIITKRGEQIGGEFRYLTPYEKGSIDASIMPHDDLANRERGQLIVKHDTQFNPLLDLNLAYNWVSDDNFFQDLGNSLATVSTTYLERHIKLTYNDQEDWLLKTQFQDFQVVDPDIPLDRYPYRRVPQTVLQWGNNDDLTGAQYGFYEELVRFQRDDRIGAWRSDFKPSLSYPFTGAGAYFTPTLAWRYTDYDLDQALSAGNHLSRSLPIFSMDSGLYFDRDTGDFIQTLEPRLYYLRVPYVDQTDIPHFDVIEPEFSYLSLFSDNRFEGADRQSDANQLSYAITSRMLFADTGAQLLQWDIGQARYFSDRKVTFSGGPPETSKFSDVVADVLLNFNDVWSVTYNQAWNTTTRQTDNGNVTLEYHPAYHQVLDLGLRYDRPHVKQSDIAFAMPLNKTWSMVGRWNYDLVNHLTLESFVGFEYDSCCWDFQILRRSFVQPDGKTDNLFFFMLELKGLGTAGRHLESLLQHGILGYGDNAFEQPDLPTQSATNP